MRITAVRFAIASVLSSILLSLPAYAERAKIAPRVYGGGKSNSTKVFSLLIESQSGRNVVFFCSGTFISSTRFLTAKHCLAKNGFSKPVFNLYRSKRGAAIRVKKKVSSPTDDVAVLTVAKVKVTPVPLMVSRSAQVGEVVNFYGYGKDEREQSALDPNARHYLKYGVAVVTKVSDKVISFINSDEGGLCHGDSGGPMLALNGDNQPGIIGVASYFRGPNRCTAGNEGSYVNVQTPAVLNFILQNAPDAQLN